MDSIVAEIVKIIKDSKYAISREECIWRYFTDKLSQSVAEALEIIDAEVAEKYKQKGYEIARCDWRTIQCIFGAVRFKRHLLKNSTKKVYILWIKNYLQRFFLYLRQSNLSCQVIQVADTSQFDTLFQRYCPRDTELMNTEAFALFFMLFLTTLKDQWIVKTQADKESKLRHICYAEYVMQWIKFHYYEEFTLAALAKELHLSSFHISHLFHKATGSTITEYLIYRRLREACLLLKTTFLSLQEICDRIGISNISYFCQLFKKRLGTTPAQYRGKPI